MVTCTMLRRDVERWAGVPREALPPAVRGHVAGCPGCTRALAAARLARGLVAAALEGSEPPEGFPGRVLAALPRRAAARPAQEDLWRPAWGLMPAFAVTAAALLLLFRVSAGPAPMGLLPAESLSAGEHLVLDAPQPDADLVLAAVMEGGA